MKLIGASLPEPQILILMVLVLFVVFFVGAQEMGWSGYAIDRLQNRLNALEARIIVGIVLAVWHIVPFMQVHQTPTWIVWQCPGMVPLRIPTVWLCSNTGKSIFVAIVFHATSNVSVFMFPNYGSHYDPFVTFLIIMFTAVIVIFVWEPETMARSRCAR